MTSTKQKEFNHFFSLFFFQKLCNEEKKQVTWLHFFMVYETFLLFSCIMPFYFAVFFYGLVLIYFSLTCSRQLLGYNIFLELILALVTGFSSSSCSNQILSLTIKQWKVPSLTNSKHSVQTSYLRTWYQDYPGNCFFSFKYDILTWAIFVLWIYYPHEKYVRQWRAKWWPKCTFSIQKHFTLFLFLMHRIRAITYQKRAAFPWGWW